MHLFQRSLIQVNCTCYSIFSIYFDSLDAVVDPCLSSTTALNKSASDLLSLAHLSSSQTPLSSSISTVNAQTLPNVSISPSNSTNNSSLLFQKPSPMQTQTIRSGTTSNIQFLNATSSNTAVRPIIFHQKQATNTSQPQLLTVMPAGVRVQQLTPVVRGSSTQPATIVRLMSPATTTLRPGGTPQQQIIQLNTNKQQQPLVIKAITAQTANRQQQPIILATNTQQKTGAPQTQQQVLVLNQNTFSNTSGQQPKFTLQMANPTPNVDQVQHEPTIETGGIPQLDGSVDDQVKIRLMKKQFHHFSSVVVLTEWYICQVRRRHKQRRNEHLDFRLATSTTSS